MLTLRAEVNTSEDFDEQLKDLPNYIKMNLIVVNSWLREELSLEELSAVLKFLSKITVLPEEKIMDAVMSVYEKEDLMNDDIPAYQHNIPKYSDKMIAITNLSLIENNAFSVIYASIKDGRITVSILD